MRRISSRKAMKGMTRPPARSHTCSAAVRVLLSAQAARRAPGGRRLRRRRCRCGELARAALALLPGEVAQALADEMDDAGLVDRLREDGVDRLREAAEAVGADEEHVLDAAVADLGQHARPEAGALA